MESHSGTAAGGLHDERDLIEQAKAGDQASLGLLFDANYGVVFRYLYAKLPRAEDAEDLAQETFLRMLNGLPRYQVRGVPFRSWLFQIAANLVNDFYRKRGAGLPAASLEEDELDLPDHRLESDPAGQIELRFEMEEVRAALGCLTELEREVIRLRYAGELSIAETAALLGKTGNNIKQLTFKALKKLREEMHQ